MGKRTSDAKTVYRDGKIFSEKLVVDKFGFTLELFLFGLRIWTVYAYTGKAKDDYKCN